MNTRRDCIEDVVNNDIRTPFGRIDGHTLCEILVRLPVKSLLQAKCVCKRWLSVIRDSYFVGLHCTRSKACPKLLIFVSWRIGRFLFSVDLLEGGVLLDQMKLELSFEDDAVQILNPVNGLVCFKGTIGQGEVLIYNPSTGDKTSWINNRYDFIADFRRSSWRINNRYDLLVIDGCVGLLDRRLIVDGDNRDVIKMWRFHDDHQEKSFTASSWTEETISIPLEREQEWIRCYPKACSELLFQAITGTNLIIMMPDQYEQRGGVFSLYCYDRKKKTLNVEISTVSNGKGYLINEPVYHIYCGTFVESLYPVQQ